MVVVDHNSTKGVIICPCTEQIDAIGTAKLYHKHVFRRYGLPDVFLSDRGPQFASQVMQELWRILGVQGRMSTAYHPQTDGETERNNQEIESYLRIFCSSYPETWANLVPDMEFALNNQEHSATKHSPFFLMYRSHPKAFPTVFPNSKVPSIQEWTLSKIRAQEEAGAALELATQRMAARVNRNFIPFQEDQKVWLETKNLETGYPYRKLAPKREGPFKIREVLSPLVYKLGLPKRMKCHDVFHASLLTPYHETAQHGPNFLMPPPDLIDGQEEYEVEALITHKKRYGHMVYLVKWKDQPTEENSWEPESHLTNAQHLLYKYKKRHGLETKPPAKSSNSATRTCLPNLDRTLASPTLTLQGKPTSHIPSSTQQKMKPPFLSSPSSRLTIRLPPRPSLSRGMSTLR